MIRAADFLRFSVDERIDLVDALWESLDPVVAVKITAHYANSDALLQEALRLPKDARIQLAQDVWDDVASSPNDVPVPAWHVEELDRRDAEVDADPDEGVPWEVVLKGIRDRIRD